ncbi:MAG: transporter [Chitinophagales bacterium]|nr:MAG: transporter [Chitinophagales bacterium]
MKKLIVFILGLVGVMCAEAQTPEEAELFSQSSFGGTARGMGVSGAFGAIGADQTGMITNPAALGLFRRIELTLTTGFEHIKTTSTYEGFRNTDRRANAYLSNTGVVIASFRKRPSQTALKGMNFGISYNRLDSYYSDRFYRSPSTYNSLLKGYKDALEGTRADNISYSGSYGFEPSLAYQAYLLDPLATDSTRYTAVTDGKNVDQRITLGTSGSSSELSFTFGANYNDKVFFGALLGIPFLNYRERYNFQEATDTSDYYFDHFSLHQNLDVSGVGVHFKTGLIYAPVNWFRFGASLHTPTFYGMSRTFWSDVTAKFDLVSTPYYEESPIGEFEYNLVTPMRVTGSLGFLFNQYGFFSLDYEWLDHRRSRYIFEDGYGDVENILNAQIERSYGCSHVLRSGLELAYGIFRLRGGVAYYSSPLKGASFSWNEVGASRYYSFGAGLRFKRFFFDWAYVRKTTTEEILFVNDVAARDKVISNQVLLTAGFRF